MNYISANAAKPILRVKGLLRLYFNSFTRTDLVEIQILTNRCTRVFCSRSTTAR